MDSIIHTGPTFEHVTTQVFEQMILPLKNKLFRFALSYLKNEDDAKDVVQDVMIKSWEEMEDVSAIRNVEAWCMTLVKNRSLDRLKRKGRNYLQVVDQHHLSANGVDPLQHTMQKETHLKIKGIIARLPEKQREVISLRDVEGYTYNEIAEILEIELNHVKVLLHRARMQVRNELKTLQEYGI
jgi:RNA polymerase sigma factor (sigma-70 family)